MGMFDDITCEMPLPEQPPPPRDRHFQTKDLDCLLERYTITARGRLIHHSVRFEDVPEDERPYPDWPFVGSICSIPTGDLDINFGAVEC